VPRLYFPASGKLVNWYGKLGFEPAFPYAGKLLNGAIREGHAADSWAEFVKPEQIEYQILDTLKEIPLSAEARDTSPHYQLYLRIGEQFSLQEYNPAAKKLPKEIQELNDLGTVTNVAPHRVRGKFELINAWDKYWTWQRANQQLMLIIPDTERLFEDEEKRKLMDYEKRQPRERGEESLGSALSWHAANILFGMQHLAQQTYQ